MATEGKIQIQADIIPTNENPRMYVTDNTYIKGSGQVFQSVAQLVAFHPARMVRGMGAIIIDWPSVGVITDFRLLVDPATMVDGSGNTKVTSGNFLTFWIIQTQANKSISRVYNYAPDGPGGGTPVFPYTLLEESHWVTLRDDSKGHKWLRFRDDDVDADLNGIFDNWSVPIAIGAQFQSGDYVENRFLRQAVSATIFTSSAGMTTGKYYIVESGTITLTGVLADSDIDFVGSGNTTILTIGKVFKHAGTVALTYNSATATEIVKTPPRTVAGLPNNLPAGWNDTIPVGTDQLWQITAQKSVYGQLKTPWALKKVAESADFIRYSNVPSPHPDTLAGVNTVATVGSGGDTALIVAGWLTVYDGQNFIATRELDPGPNIYTSWLVQKINEESGEFIDKAYKLFDLNLDSTSLFLVPPTLADATAEGWSDTPLIETATQINYESQARKFFDGTLKTPWGTPVPYTGKDVFIDTIDAIPSDNFKYDDTGTVVPANITLQANIYKGTNELWTDTSVAISYAWKRVYNNSAVDTTTPTGSPADPFYLLGATLPIRANQRVVVKAAAVTGMAVFRCTQTITLPQGDPIIFIQEFTINDVTDGIDAKQLALGIDIQTVIFDSTNAVHVPASIYLQAFPANIPSPTFYWYKYTGGVWVKFTAADANHVFPNGINGANLRLDIFKGTPTAVVDAVIAVPGAGAAATLSSAGNHLPAMLVNDTFEIRDHSNPADNGYYKVIVVTTSTTTYQVNKLSGSAAVAAASEAITIYTGVSYLLTPDQVQQELRYAVSTHATSPTSADNIATFSDFGTLVKLGSANVGSPGQNAYSTLLNNESHTVVIDPGTTQPYTGEITNTGKARTLVQLYDGATKKTITTDYTIALASDNGSITFGQQVVGTDAEVYVNTWGAGQRSAICTITITYGIVTLTKKFSISSTVAAPGAILVDIDSDKGYIFTPQDKTNKTLTVKLYDTSLAPPSQLIALPDAMWTFRWRINGSWGTTTTAHWQQVIQQTDILVSSVVTLEVYRSTVLFRSLTINMTDVNDGRSFRAWTDFATKPSTSQDLSNQDPTPVSPPGWFGVTGDSPLTISGVAWYLPTATYWATHTPTFAQDATLAAGVYTWNPVYQLKGDIGSQGASGNFYHSIWIIYDPSTHVPGALPDVDNNGIPDMGAGGSTSTLAQMITVGWTSHAPTGIGVFWRTERLWTGQGVTFNGSGDPSTGPVTGGSWTTPVKVSAKDGSPAAPAVDGTNGWSPYYAVVAGVGAGEKVLQLIDWVGGTGTKPGFINQYVSATGFTTVLASAAIVTGQPVEMRFDSTTRYVQWKYTNESSGSWRNLYLTPGANAPINVWNAAGGGTLSPSGSPGVVDNWFYIDTGNTNSKKLQFRAYCQMHGGGFSQLMVAGGNTANTLQLTFKLINCQLNALDQDFTCEGACITSVQYILVYIRTNGNSLSNYGLTVTEVV